MDNDVYGTLSCFYVLVESHLLIYLWGYPDQCQVYSVCFMLVLYTVADSLSLINLLLLHMLLRCGFGYYKIYFFVFKILSYSGRFLAEVTKEVLQDLEASKYQVQQHTLISNVTT